jgi:hypothetical protein
MLKALRHGGTILGTFAGFTLTSIRSQAMLHVANPKDCSSTAEDAKYAKELDVFKGLTGND